MQMIDRLRSYKDGVHGPFFLEVADRIEKLEKWIARQDPSFLKDFDEWVALKVHEPTRKV